MGRGASTKQPRIARPRRPPALALAGSKLERRLAAQDWSALETFRGALADYTYGSQALNCLMRKGELRPEVFDSVDREQVAPDRTVVRQDRYEEELKFCQELGHQLDEAFARRRRSTSAVFCIEA
jgi:hypothetical protein